MAESLRKKEEVTLGGKDYFVYELTPNDIINIFGGLKEQYSSEVNEAKTGNKKSQKGGVAKDGSIEGLEKNIEDMLKVATTITLEEVRALPFSEINRLREKFMEVNASFLEITDWLGMTEAVKVIANGIKGSMLTHLSGAVSASFTQGT